MEGTVDSYERMMAALKTNVLAPGRRPWEHRRVLRQVYSAQPIEIGVDHMSVRVPTPYARLRGAAESECPPMERPRCPLGLISGRVRTVLESWFYWVS